MDRRSLKAAAAKGMTQKEYVDDMVADMQRILKLYAYQQRCFYKDH